MLALMLYRYMYNHLSSEPFQLYKLMYILIVGAKIVIWINGMSKVAGWLNRWLIIYYQIFDIWMINVVSGT